LQKTKTKTKQTNKNKTKAKMTITKNQDVTTYETKLPTEKYVMCIIIVLALLM